MADKTNNTANTAASVQVDPAKVAQTRLILDGCSKKIEMDLSAITKSVEDIALSWDSEVSRNFAIEAGKKVTLIRQENGMIDKNIKTFLDNFLAAYDAHEQFVKTAAELFK